jgi:predicted RNA methylase
VAQLDPTVKDILLRAEFERGRGLVLPSRLSRTEYVATDLVLQNLGWKWSRKNKAHTYERPGGEDDNPVQRLADALSGGTFVDRKKDLQFFPTPGTLADLMVETAGVEPGHCVLEPSAGIGSIVWPCLYRDAQVLAVEIDPSNAAQIRHDARARLRPEVETIEADFLAWAEDDGAGLEFDAVIMNPPFSKGRDIAHVRKAWDFVRPGGRLVAITSPGWTYREDRKHTQFREWFEAQGGIKTELEAGTFAEAGTDVRSVMIVLQRN